MGYQQAPVSSYSSYGGTASGSSDMFCGNIGGKVFNTLS